MIENGDHPAYEGWRTNPADRQEDAANLFGLYLMRHCRSEAIDEVPAGASAEVRRAVEKGVDAALHNVMDLLEGYWSLPAGKDLRAELALHVDVFREDALVESQSVSPGQIDLPIGYWAWVERYGDRSRDLRGA
ncbi:MAG TPA: hypothetical protein VHG35_17710 [Gemmatimonadales bacterium]|nr:hypothetical protein [Gemmatimonadales bacterium]